MASGWNLWVWLQCEGTRRWYPFEGGCKGSVLEGGGMEIVGGRVCTDAEV